MRDDPQERQMQSYGRENTGFRQVSGHFACVPKAIKDVPIQIEFARRPPYSFIIGWSNKQTKNYK
jgi:hypothetical protein